MTSRSARIALPGLVLLVLAVVGALAAQAAAGDNPVLRDAGALVRLGGPIAALLADLTASLALGAAMLAGWLLPAQDRSRAMLLTAVGAGVATLARLVGLLLSYALATGQQPTDPRFGSDLGVYVATDLGVWLLTAVVLMAGATTVALAGSSRGLARTVTALLAASLGATAMTGHAAGGDTHEVATSTMAVHLLAVGVWVGGLLALVLLPSGRGTERPTEETAAVLRGYSHLALIAWIALGISGVWALAVRMNGLSDLWTSPYVQIAEAKAALLLAMAAFGVMQRRALTSTVAGASTAVEASRAAVPIEHPFRRLAVLELALMGLAIALAAALSSSPPPAVEVPPPADLAAALTGYPLPPAPSVAALLTAWRPDPLGLALACALLLVWWRPQAPARPHRGRTLLLAGAFALVLLTSGPLAVYSKVLASAHLVLHAGLVVVGLVLGAAWPLPSRLRERLAARGWVAPLLAAIAAAAPVIAYAQPRLLRLALDSHVAHVGLQLLALTVGAGIAVAARCATRPWVVVVASTVPLLFGAVVLSIGGSVLAPSWFGATGRTWMPDALADQRRGGIAVAVAVMVAAPIGLLAARGARRPQ